MKTEKLKQKVFDIYRDMYAQAEPKTDFDKLLEDAEINELGQKVIPFNDYTLDAEIGEGIIKKHCRWLRDFDKKQIAVAVNLGCSPKYNNYIKTILLLLFPILMFGQNKEIKIYDSKNGVRNFIPSKVIEIDKNTTKVFEVKNGVKEIIPIQIIEDNKIYQTVGGIKNVGDFKTIEISVEPKTLEPIWKP